MSREQEADESVSVALVEQVSEFTHVEFPLPSVDEQRRLNVIDFRGEQGGINEDSDPRSRPPSFTTIVDETCPVLEPPDRQRNR